MQSLKVLWRSRRSGIHRSFSHIPYHAAANDFDYEVLVEGEGCSRTAILNGPHVLNALNASMVFATPETLIGFHTDAGASFHLSHLPGYWGEY